MPYRWHLSFLPSFSLFAAAAAAAHCSPALIMKKCIVFAAINGAIASLHSPSSNLLLLHPLLPPLQCLLLLLFLLPSLFSYSSFCFSASLLVQFTDNWPCHICVHPWSERGLLIYLKLRISTYFDMLQHATSTCPLTTSINECAVRAISAFFSYISLPKMKRNTRSPQFSHTPKWDTATAPPSLSLFPFPSLSLSHSISVKWYASCACTKRKWKPFVITTTKAVGGGETLTTTFNVRNFLQQGRRGGRGKAQCQ